MRIGFYLADQNPHRDRTLGITTYTAALLKQFGSAGDLTISSLESRSSFAPADPVAERRVLPFRTDNALGRLLADQTHPLLAKLDVDLWHYPKGFLPLALRYSGPIVGTVCDVILQHYADRHPKARSSAAYAYWLLLLRRSIPRFDRICTISHFSKARILEFAERYRIKCPEVTVTYLGCNWDIAPSSVKEDFVLHLASRELHKRTSTLLEFWREMEGSGGANLQLELVGSLTDADRGRAMNLKSARISPRLSRDELDERFRRARALILPSEIEGFGFPALEAYAVGTPALYVKETTVEELLGKETPGGFFLDSLDSFRAALNEALQMSPTAIEAKKEELRPRFSWSACAEQTLAVYRECLSR